ncbi:MAG: GNAT family N-acetyltransferase [Desulfococcaceae bacterium]
MGLYHLENLFHPRSIAIVGASDKKRSVGRALMENMENAGYEGDLYPINPDHDRLFDRDCHPTVSDAPKVPDLAVIAIPLSVVPDVMAECAEIGVKGAVVLSAGGKETGEEGRMLEERIREAAEQGGVRIIGPNCLGIICPEEKLNASFVAHAPPSGNLAFISQSGAICSAMLDLSLKENMGYRYFISVGSMLDVDFGDLIDYVGNDPEVGSVLLYVESLKNFRKFMSAARAVSRIKPIVVLKSGRSEIGAQAASSHTGAMAGEDRIYDAAFQRAGAVRVRTVAEFFNCAELLAKQKRPNGPRMTVLTNSGGPGVMAADAIAEFGLSAAELGEGTMQKLDQALPPYWSRNNPIDILGDAGADRYVDALKALNPEETDGLLVILNPQAMTDPAEVARAVVEAANEQPYPVFASWMGGRDVSKGIQVLNAAGIPTYPTPEQGVLAFRYLYDYKVNLELLTEIPPRVSRELTCDREAAASCIRRGLARENGLLTETEAKAVLAAYRAPVNPTRLAESREEAREIAEDLGFPLAMKIASPDVVHKSRAGGVRLGLETAEEAARAWDEVIEAVRERLPDAQIHGVSLQPMVESVDLELLMGAKKDPDFGPVLLFGWGGIHAETIDDRNLGLAPLNRQLARNLMEPTRVFGLVKGDDSRDGLADPEDLEEILVCLSNLVIDFPEIKELDINPVAVVDGKPVALDARIVVEESELESPRHLSISPYPREYEVHDVSTDGLSLCIRPIQPEDAPLMGGLLEQCSEKSIYQRFFSHMRKLPRHMLIRFTQIDYDREMALVALTESAEEEKMLGIARVIGTPGGKKGEFAVLVGDPWQGKGIGAELLTRVLRIVQERGMETVWGAALAQNTQMANLARELGFEIERESGGDFQMTIDLTSADLST